MLRRLNYTGRKRIPKRCVRIHVREDGDERLFDAEIDLSGLDLPEAAEVYLEAYHRAAYMRFPFGTVGRIEPPRDRKLRAIPVVRPLFRLKVVAKAGRVGRILAQADRIVPLWSEMDEEETEPLLFVEFGDLGSGVWRLDLDGDWPTLFLNRAIEGIREAARSGTEFLTLVYPEVVRAALGAALAGGAAEDAEGAGEEETDWRILWIRFGTELAGAPPPRGAEAEEGAQSDWIDDAVEGFASRHRVAERFAELLLSRAGS